MANIPVGQPVPDDAIFHLINKEMSSVLCKSIGTLYVTTSIERVTCPQCLELLVEKTKEPHD